MERVQYWQRGWALEACVYGSEEMTKMWNHVAPTAKEVITETHSTVCAHYHSTHQHTLIKNAHQ